MRGAHVLGGGGSIHANLVELVAGAQRLIEISEETDSLANRSGAWGTGLALPTAATQSGAQLGATVAQLVGQLTWVSGETRGLANDLRTAVQRYHDAEHFSWSLFDRLLVPYSSGRVVGDVLRGNDPSTQDVARFLEHGPSALMNTVTNGLPVGGPVLGTTLTLTRAAMQRVSKGTPLSSVERTWLAMGGMVNAAGMFRMGPYRVADTTRISGTLNGPASGWVSQGEVVDPVDLLLGSQRRVAPDLAGQGAFQVTKVVHPDGSEVFIVSIPGTQAPEISGDWREDLGLEDNPWGLTGMREAMTLDSQHVIAAIQQALELSGAEPGDTVIASGYSQGGAHAANFVTDPRILETYNVQGLVNFGAPDHHVEFDPELTVLGFQHAHDVATALSGPIPAGGARHATVVFEDLPEGSDPAAGGVFGAGHGWDNIDANTRQALDDPAVRAMIDPQLQNLAALTTGGVASAKTFKLTRQDPGRPQDPRSPSGSSSQFAPYPTRAPRSVYMP